MKRRLATRGGILLPAFVLALMLQAGCGGDAEVTIVDENDTPDVAGVLLLPDGSGGTAPTDDTQVIVTRITGQEIQEGDEVGATVIGDQFTDAAGRYQISLGGDIIDDCEGGRVLVRSESGGLTRALAFSDEEDINVDYNSEALMRLVFQAVNEQGADFCSASNDDLRNLLSLVTQATEEAGVSGTTVTQINNAAFIAAESDPEVLAAVAAAFDISPFTPTRTPTPTGTPTSVTTTPTATGEATATNTPEPTNTNTPEPTSTNTGEPTSTNTVEPTDTPTEPIPTDTPTEPVPPTDTPTIPIIIDTPTNTPVPTDTSTPEPTSTETAVPTETNTAEPTPTNTVDMNLPNVAIGSASGAPGANVTVGFTLTKNGPAINVIAPLEFDFDNTRLTFTGSGATTCVSTVAGKNPTINVSGNRVGVALSGSEDPFPDGLFLNCTFSILAEASGVAPITFVRAGMADGDFNDYDATGTSGQVTIDGGGEPTSTPTEVPPTATEVPATATEVPPTATEVPATATATEAAATATATEVPPTATEVPPTATEVPSTPTATAVPATPTATMGGGGNVPNVAIGSTSGAAGANVTVGFTLTKNGPAINVIAPLEFDFDNTRLTFTGSGTTTCVSTVAGKNPTINVSGNRVGVALSGSEDPFPDGLFLNCTFTIQAAASGVAPITFVRAGMADGDFNDYDATGSSGQVTIEGGAEPTATAIPPTPTMVASTPTATIPTNVPVIVIGNVAGTAGGTATVPFTLTKNGPGINVIAPLEFDFDNTRLAFTGSGATTCVSTVTGKNPTVNVAGNRIGVALSGSEEPFPDGLFLNCTFSVLAEASGVAPITFVRAGMADGDFNDYDAFGVSGSVTVQ